MSYVVKDTLVIYDGTTRKELVTYMQSWITCFKSVPEINQAAHMDRPDAEQVLKLCRERTSGNYELVETKLPIRVKLNAPVPAKAAPVVPKIEKALEAKPAPVAATPERVNDASTGQLF